MNREQLRDLLDDVAQGSLSSDDALDRLRYAPVADLGFAQVDVHRPLRTGFPEAIYCNGKTPDQVAAIAHEIAAGGNPVIGTKASREVFDAVREALPQAEFHEPARLITVAGDERGPTRGHVTVVSGGTADLPIAQEAVVTAQVLGAEVASVSDAGVAGLHRLLAHRAALDAADAIVVVAGMEGALPSVVGGLVDRPVIAAPTSIGYGVSLGGIAALLTMLSACAPGISVVNIDNGFGAGYQAALIARRASESTE